MIVCVCKAVNDRAIRRAVAEGHDSFDAIQFELGVGTQCGRCVATACEVLCDARLAACASRTSAPTMRPVHPIAYDTRPSSREPALA